MSTDAVKTGEPVAVAAADPGDEIRKFNEAGIHAAITKALAQLPDDQRVAVVGHVDTHGEIQAAVMARVTGGWSFVGVLRRTPTKGFVGEAGVLWSR